MRIFIDESGNFTAGTGVSRTCCVAALIVPETQVHDLSQAFVNLRASWTSEAEIKSSTLTDDQTTAVLELLAQYDVVAVVTAFDKQHHPPEQLQAFQQRQANAFTNALTPEHKENAHRFATALRDEWLKLSPQLMAQLHTMMVTIEDIIRLVPNYYAQHRAAELGRWEWVIDPKDLKPTRYEEVWQKVVCPLLQTVSVGAPFMRIEGLDYSAFDRFRMAIPDYVHPLVRQTRAGAEGDAVNLNLLLRETVAFPDSRDEPGLQLTDILAGTLTKAMNQVLPEPVWRRLGPLLLQRPNREPVVKMIALGDGPRIPVDDHHERVLRELTARCKPMLRDDEPPSPRLGN
jgi:hypothetical protein